MAINVKKVPKFIFGENFPKKRRNIIVNQKSSKHLFNKQKI